MKAQKIVIKTMLYPLLVYILTASTAVSDAGLSLTLSSATSHVDRSAQKGLLETFFLNPDIDPQRRFFLGLSDGRMLSVAWHKALPMTLRGGTFIGTVRASHSSKRFVLPDGVDIFRDPARLSLHAFSVWGNLEWRRDTHFPWRGQGHLGLSAGVVASYHTAHLTSALLDIRHKGYSTSGFVKLSAVHDIAQSASGLWRVTTELYVFDRTSADITLGLSVKF